MSFGDFPSFSFRSPFCFAAWFEDFYWGFGSWERAKIFICWNSIEIPHISWYCFRRMFFSLNFSKEPKSLTSLLSYLLRLYGEISIIAHLCLIFRSLWYNFSIKSKGIKKCQSFYVIMKEETLYITFFLSF